MEIRSPTTNPGRAACPARGQRLAQEPQPAGRIAAPRVGAQVGPRVEELRGQVPVRGHDLHAVQAGGLQARRRRPEPVDDLRDQRAAHRPRHHVEALRGHRTRRPGHGQRPVGRVHDLPPAVEQLAEDRGPVAVDRLGQRREARDRLVLVRGQLGRGVARRRVDARNLDDDEPGSASRAGLLVRHQPVRDQPVHGHDGVMPGRHDPVADRRPADRGRLEQVGERRAPGSPRRLHLRRMARAPAGAQHRRAGRPAIVPGWDASALSAHWLGRIGYRDAWDLQKGLAMARAADRIGDQLLLLEHPAVLTLGRGADEFHVLAPPALLEARGIELLRVERGGEVTYHGPGQLVAYPIIKLADRGLLLRPLVRALEAALAEHLRGLRRAPAAPLRRGPSRASGRVDPEGAWPRKIGALGIRIERGTKLPRHRAERGRGSRGLRPDRPVRDARPGLDVHRPRGRPSRRAPVHGTRGRRRPRCSPGRLPPGSSAPLEGHLPPDADPVAERATLVHRLAAAAGPVPA